MHVKMPPANWHPFCSHLGVFHAVRCWVSSRPLLNTLRPRQNGRHFPDDIFKWIFLNENVWISINISLNFVPRGLINNIPTLVQAMAWRWPGDKPLSEPMIVRFPTYICVTGPQWVKELGHLFYACWQQMALPSLAKNYQCSINFTELFLFECRQLLAKKLVIA